MGLEIVEDLPELATIVVPVGGGGLIAGVAMAAVDGAASSASSPSAPRRCTAALEAGEPVRHRAELDGRRPQRALHAGPARSRSCRERVDEVVLVTEEEIAEGMRFLYTRAKLACEPAGAAAVAALLAGKIEVEAGSPVVAVVSGGNADPKVAAGILASR